MVQDFVGRFFCLFFVLILASVSLVVICLLGFLFFLDSVLKDCMFLGIYLFLPDYPVCWQIVAHNIFLNPLLFCGVNCYFSFISDFIYLGPFSFFLDGSV